MGLLSQTNHNEALRSATKVYNDPLRHLREAYKATGKIDLSRKNLNRILKGLPRGKLSCRPRKVPHRQFCLILMREAHDVGG